ncbi:hypothetical protein [Pyrobaculum aerophilum]|uniref:hypothetical protein n=1 Tax=Pyrobaculum aerophilum TaxID=13773 RepID=UPI002FD9D505
MGGTYVFKNLFFAPYRGRGLSSLSWSFARCWLRICRGGGGEAVAVGVDQPPSAGEVV